MLADLGAEVIKIEDPAAGGDVARTIPPGAGDGDSLYFQAFNRGKRSIALDLKSDADRDIFHRLVREADAVFNNLRGDLPDRLGLTYATLGRVNPAIICVSLSAYGRTGSRAAEPGYDALVQAEAGWAALTGEPNSPPARSGLPLADYAAGLTAALALVSGVLEARRTGIGRDLDTSLYDTALSMLAYQATWLLTAGIETERQPMSAHPTVVPFQFFATSDGYLAIACAKEKFFTALVELMDLPELAGDPRYRSFAARHEHRQVLLARLSERFQERTTGEWIALLRDKVPCAPVRSMRESLDPDDLAGRSMLATFDHERFGEVRSVGLPVRVAGYEPSYRRAPAFDADREALLDETGPPDPGHG
jgi:crotonobetainyl-CoA:carnitine CoA-transferase CaiB-like acyl-CoA transferase